MARWVGNVGANTENPQEGPLRTGDLVEDVALPDDRGAIWRLSDHRGHPVLLIFHRHLM